jgi:hypothetical protein
MTTSDGTVIGTTKILDNGPASVRWNLVMLGDGYRQQELPQFAGDAQDAVNTLLATPPFDEYKAAINVFRVDVASTDSGADDPVACGGTGITADTFFDASFCNQGIQRLLVVNNATVEQVASDEVPEWHVAFVLVNSSVYGGSGSPADGIAVFSLHNQAVLIALHELGHAGFGLADEYSSYAGCNSGETGHDQYTGGEPAEANVTANTNRASLKWGNLVLPTTPVPTTANANCAQCDPQPSPVPAGAVGTFEGARYFHCGLYRPEFDCRMRDHTQPFCAVCELRIRETLEPFLPIGSPMNYMVIDPVRQHFGNEPDFLPGQFVGQQKDFPFDCPSIDRSQAAVLMFQSLHVSNTRNVFEINGQTVFGDLPTTADDRDAWAGQVLLVSPNVLRATGNVLHVESRTDSGSTSGDIDDFVIDNVVVFYKTVAARDLVLA